MEIPNNYYISKGNTYSQVTENGVMELECYEYKIKKGQNNWYLASCDELNAYAQGKTWKELKSNILESHEEMLYYV